MTSSGADRPKIVPMRSTFAFLYLTVVLVLLAFTINGMWFSRQVHGLADAINMAGTQRMRTFEMAYLVNRAHQEDGVQREETLAVVRKEAARFAEVQNALEHGDPRYGLKDTACPRSKAKIQANALRWHTEFAPLIFQLTDGPPGGRGPALEQLNAGIGAFVNNDLHELTGLLADQLKGAEQKFNWVRSLLIGFAIFAIGLNLLYVRRRILEPIRVLMIDTSRVEGGDYTVQTRVEVRNELFELGDRFNAMTAALAKAFGEMESTIAERTHELSMTSSQLRSFIDSAPDAIISVDANDRSIILFSMGAEKMFGYEAEEVLGKNVNILMPEPFRSNHEEYVARYLTTGIKKAIGTIRVVSGRKKDGSEFDIDLSISESTTERGRVFNAIIRDISERVRAEREVERKNFELQVAARIDRIGARVMIALNQHEEHTTPGAEVLRVLADEAGYRPLAFYEYDEWQGELSLGVSLSLGSGFTRETFRKGEGLVGEAAASREPVFVESVGGRPFELDTGVGALKAAAVFAIPLVHREKLLGVISGASHTPLLERERNSLAQTAGQVAIGLYSIRQFQELKELSRQLNKRTRRIEQQNRELDRANRLKSEFLASMSHELRTPLNAIIGFSEVLKDGLLGALPAEQLDYVAEIYQSGHHLLSLINDILDLSKIEAGKMTLHVEPVELAALVTNALTIVKERAATQGVALSSSLASDWTTIEADGRKVRQMVYNLLSNAVKFTPSGGSVHLEVTGDAREIEIAVVDTGIGISAADQELLFRPFEQVDGGVSRQYEGTGLGLVLTRRLAELHHGTVGVSSELGAGSRFWIRLPRTSPQNIDTTGSTLAHAVAPTATRPDADASYVLVVDDDPAALALARRWLGKEGYRVEEAQSCELAWSLVQDAVPDAILLDILFGHGQGGWEFLRQLKGLAKTAFIPVVIVSIVAEIERGLALGAVDVLQKPVAGSDLLRAVESLGLVPTRSESVHILVVDDDPRAVEHVSTRLEAHHMNVTRTYGGADALAALADGEFDAVVLDLMMPECSGFDVLRELRSDPATAELPIIVLTAKTLEPAESALLEKCVATVLSKGEWDARTFISVVRSAIMSGARRKKAGPHDRVGEHTRLLEAAHHTEPQEGDP